MWHVFHQTYNSPLGFFIVASGEPSAHSLADSFSVCLAPRRLLRSGLCFVLQAHAAGCFSCVAVSPRFRVSLHATLLSLVVRWLRRQPSRSPPSPILDAGFFSFAPILGFGSSILPRSFASSRLTTIFSPSSSTSCYVRAALLRARLLVWSVPPAPSCGSLEQRGLLVVTPALLCSTLPRRGCWTCASAVVFTTTWSADFEETFLGYSPTAWSLIPCLSVLLRLPLRGPTPLCET